MKIDENNLSRLETDYGGYLKGEAVDAFFEDFDIKFSAGHWCAGDFYDRFATEGYNSNDPDFSSDILSQIRRVKQAGIKGIEMQSHLFVDDRFNTDHDTVKNVKAELERQGMVPTNMALNLFSDPKWKLGSLTNPDRSRREDAVAAALQGVETARDLGCTSVTLWPGSDGWDYNFQADHEGLLERFIEGCCSINEGAVRSGLRFGVEAKLHEPREGNMILPTSHMSILVANEVNERCGGSNMGLIIDYGHEQMYGVNPGFTLCAAKVFGVPLVNFHINTAKLHSNDEDRVAGTGDNWRLAEFCYAAIKTGYSGWFSEDQFTYRMDPVKAMALSKELFSNVMKKALLIYKNRSVLEDAQATGDAGRTIDAVKEILM